MLTGREPSTTRQLTRTSDSLALKSARQLKVLSTGLCCMRFVEMASAANSGRIADIGCGPGRVAAFLARLGVDVVGFDVSTAMLDNARIAHPAINFEQGQLAAVPVPDASLIGAICWYSIIYTPPELLNVAFSELRRTLVPGGYLLLAFQAGRSEGQLRPDAHGTGFPLTSYLHDPDVVERPTLRASFDDFKKPWRDAREKGYDRISGEGYYRNAPDFDSARRLLLGPAGPCGSGTVVLCAHDPLTGTDHRSVTVEAPRDAVLIVDSVFAMRPEYDEYWDFRIWLDVPVELSLARGIKRDSQSEGRAEAERVHRDRYHPSERIYITEVNPIAKADLVIDNTDFANVRAVSPAILKRWKRSPRRVKTQRHD